MTLSNLNDQEIERYARQITLQDIGLEGQIALRKAKVSLIGIGGLGCPAALQLVGLGVGSLKIVDRDIVSKSDLHRQYLYTSEDIGLPKVEAAFNRLSKLNPDVKIEAIPESFSSSIAHDVLGDSDIVIDGLDRMAPRYILNRACVDIGIPYVFGGALELRGNVFTIIPGETACLECIYPGIDDDRMDRCAVVGVHPSILGLISSIQVSETTRIITGKKPHLAGKLWYADLSNLSFDLIPITRVDECSACGSEKGNSEIINASSIEETCARDGRSTFVIKPKNKIDIEIPLLGKKIEVLGYRLITKSKLGISFEYNARIKVNILKSGIGIIQVAPPRSDDDRRQVVESYNLSLHELGIKEQIE